MTVLDQSSDLTYLVWWTSVNPKKWPSLVVVRSCLAATEDQAERYLLAMLVRLIDVDTAWAKVSEWDATAVRFGPSTRQYKRVVIESPFRGGDPRMKAYLKRCMADSIACGEAPFASHRLYPGILNDGIPEERELGMQLGFAWRLGAQLTVVYTDHGISKGMKEGIEDAQAIGQLISYRQIGVDE